MRSGFPGALDSTAEEPFVARLFVFSDEVTVHRTAGLRSTFENTKMPLLALSFDYGDTTITRDSDAFDPCRDPLKERGARRIIESFGAIDLDCMEDYAVAPDVCADYVIACDGDVHDYCSFVSSVLPQLRALGFEITISDDFEYRTLDQKPVWYAEVEEEKPDWFSLGLGIELDGKRVSLLEPLLGLLEQSSSGDGLGGLAKRAQRSFAIPVGDRLYVTVPPDRVRTILRVLAELYEGKGSIDIHFHKTRAAALERLSLAFADSEDSIRIIGSKAEKVLAFSRNARIAVEPPSTLQAELRPYQLEGLTWLQNLRERECGGILADDMGLGKTLQTIAHIALEKFSGRMDKPALIVAPTSVVGNWVRECKKFAPNLRVLLIHGNKRQESYAKIETSDVVITSYPLAVRDEDLLQEHEFYLLILDEAQTIKNEKSQSHRAVRTFRAKHRLCLTGTPVENHLGELWSISDFLNPGLLGDEVHFARFFRVPIEKQRNNERLAALRDLLGPYILRRTKAEVAKDLPPKTELFRPVELRGVQRELYETIRVAAHAEVRKLIKKKGLAASTIPILGALTKLRQVCCDPRLAGLDKKSVDAKSCKLALFEDMVTDSLKSGQRILVFSQFTSMLALIAERLTTLGISFTSLTGATVDRMASVDRFEQGKVDVFLISLRAGGTGLTLTSADMVIHYDPWWNPAVQAQATDRAYRIGQKKPVFVHHLYAAGSVEERMLRLQRSKRRVADAILGEGDASSALTEEDVEVLFAPLGA